MAMMTMRSNATELAQAHRHVWHALWSSILNLIVNVVAAVLAVAVYDLWWVFALCAVRFVLGGLSIWQTELAIRNLGAMAERAAIYSKIIKSDLAPLADRVYRNHNHPARSSQRSP
jgi:hypothetical protein